MNGQCPFCNMSNERVVAENWLAYAVLDRYPVTSGHCLIIPKRHVPSFFDLNAQEVEYCLNLMRRIENMMIDLMKDDTIIGYNVGINVGTAAGQTVDHCHIHLIPRRPGDVANPVGGIRNVIPGKGDYLANTKES